MMAAGPGVYDDLCTYVRERAEARAAIVIVLRGRYGDGFSVQIEGGYLSPQQLAKLLREYSAQMEGLPE